MTDRSFKAERGDILLDVRPFNKEPQVCYVTEVTSRMEWGVDAFCRYEDGVTAWQNTTDGFELLHSAADLAMSVVVQLEDIPSVEHQRLILRLALESLS